MKRFILGIFVAILLIFAMAAPQSAVAVTAPAGEHNVSYVIAYEPLFGTHIPYVGWLQLKVQSGIITGTYRGLSISGDDPFVNRISTVSGGTSGENIHFDIGNGASRLSFNGRVEGNWLEGSAQWRGRLYRLSGQVGRPHGM